MTNFNGTYLIGVSGKKRHGKGEAADIIRMECEARYRPAVVRGFATSLKDEVAVFLAPMLSPMPFFAVRAMLDDPEQKENFRLVLQWWGSFRRNYFAENYWIDRFDDWMSTQPEGVVVIIDDLRYPNEAEYVLEAGGEVVRVERPGFGKADTHISETAMDDYDGFFATVENSGNLADFQAKVSELCLSLLLS